MRVVTTLTSVALVWCALLTHRVVVVEEYAIDEAPTTMASFVQVVAVHAELHRQINLLAVPYLDATLQHAIRRYNVTGAASLLVNVSPREVVSHHIVPSEFLGELIHIYVVRVFTEILLSFPEGSPKLFSVLTKGLANLLQVYLGQLGFIAIFFVFSGV